MLWIEFVCVCEWVLEACTLHSLDLMFIYDRLTVCFKKYISKCVIAYYTNIE